MKMENDFVSLKEHIESLLGDESVTAVGVSFYSNPDSTMPVREIVRDRHGRIWIHCTYQRQADRMIVRTPASFVWSPQICFFKQLTNSDWPKPEIHDRQQS
jgi:hypothetical protein